MNWPDPDKQWVIRNDKPVPLWLAVLSVSLGVLLAVLLVVLLP